MIGLLVWKTRFVLLVALLRQLGRGVSVFLARLSPSW
jgi:hypothetical protein